MDLTFEEVSGYYKDYFYHKTEGTSVKDNGFQCPNLGEAKACFKTLVATGATCCQKHRLPSGITRNTLNGEYTIRCGSFEKPKNKEVSWRLI